MTQLFRAAAPVVVPGPLAQGRGTKPRGRARRRPSARLARATAFLAIAGLAACTDSVTSPSAPRPAPRMAESGSGFTGEYLIPIPTNSLIGTSTIPWTNTGITVPRAGKYRIRVQGMVTVSQHPDYPGPCPATVLGQYLGNWGPMGRPALGTSLRVAFFDQAATDWGWAWTAVDSATIETVQRLDANTAVWAARQGLGAEVRCSAHPDPIPMFAFSGRQVLTVTEVPPPTLECKGANGENPIERAKTVRCSITPDRPYRVLSRRATGKGFTIAETLDSSYAADVPHVWQGGAVADTRVSMVLELTNDDGSTERKTYTADFQVSPRDWPKLQVNAPKVTVGLRATMQPYPPADGRGELGNAKTEIDSAAIAALRLARQARGPNAGLTYLLDPWPALDFTIFLHPALYDDAAHPTAPWQVWHADQNGVGSGTCTQAVFTTTLEPAVRRHEGATQAPDSHWGIAHDFFQSSNVEQEMETVYRQTTNADEVTQAAFDRLKKEISGKLTPLQEAFDRTDTPVLIASLGCTLDHRRNDP